MITDDFILNCNTPLQTIFDRLGNVPEKVILIVDDNNKVLGTITDGDIRRSLSQHDQKFFSLKANDIMNINFVYDEENAVTSQKKSFTDAIKIIPVLDSNGILKYVRKAEVKEIIIGDHVISEQSPVYIIAEIGNNHNGSIDTAYELIRKAKLAGANAVKFQMRQLEETYIESINDGIAEDLGSQYTLDLLKKFQLTNDQLLECFDFCKSIGIEPLCTPWDRESVKILNNYGIAAFKVASADLTNYELIQELSITNKPVIFSTGMSSEKQIQFTVDFLDGKINHYALLHCNSSYPAPYKDINLHYMTKLKHISKTGIVGYSGHERGIEVPLAAISLGAKIIEKHFTLDRAMEGSDHKISLLPNEFKQMVSSIRNIESSLIYSDKRIVTQGEILNRESLGKSIVASKKILKGSTISMDDITLKSPGKGLSPDLSLELIGKKAIREMLKDDIFYPSDLKQEINKFSDYSFNREFGIPVRYHDLNILADKCNFDFVEFHLSYGDMNLNLNKIIGRTYDSLSFKVHAPELFEGDHVIDLASRDKAYRKLSIDHMHRVIDESEKLFKYFPNSDKPHIVFNAGGFSENGFVSDEYKNESYLLIEESLKNFQGLNNSELLIQTMPPYPWHFGGQRFHNNFVDPHEIKDFCSRTKYNICLDLSHSYLACNHLDYSLDQFLDLTHQYIKYMHIVDAKGEDGEGLQIGDGEIDFNLFSILLRRYNIKAGFIPEIWQGHKDSGHGFITALNKLNKVGM